MKIKKVIACLKKDGWELVCQNGSHKQFKHPNKKGRVTVPVHNGDLNINTLKSIEKQAKIDLRNKNKKKKRNRIAI